MAGSEFTSKANLDLRALWAKGFAVVLVEVRGVKPDVMKWVDKKTGKAQERDVVKLAMETVGGREVVQISGTLWGKDVPAGVEPGTVCFAGVTGIEREKGSTRCGIGEIVPVAGWAGNVGF